MSRTIYVPLSVNFPDDPKVMAAGERAAWLYIRMLCLAQRLLSDGHIADIQLPLLGVSGINKRLGDLERVGLIERTENGWLICAYLKWNRTAARVAEISEERAKAGAKGGSTPRVGKQFASDDAEQFASDDESNLSDDAEASWQPKTKTSQNGSKQSSRAGARSVENPESIVSGILSAIREHGRTHNPKDELDEPFSSIIKSLGWSRLCAMTERDLGFAVRAELRKSA